MKKPLHPVTDHAVLRYLERVKGIDIEAVRCEIGRKVDLAVQHGAEGIVVDGFCYKLLDGHVTTIWRKNQPNKQTHRGRRREA